MRLNNATLRPFAKMIDDKPTQMTPTGVTATNITLLPNDGGRRLTKIKQL